MENVPNKAVIEKMLEIMHIDDSQKQVYYNMIVFSLLGA